MIRTLLVAAASLFALHKNSFAQQAPGTAAGAPIIQYTTAADTVIENRLVAWVLKGPEYDASIHQNRITELELKRAKNTWLNLLTISTNYNDQSFAKPQGTNGQAAYIYPKYFFGVTIPLGIIFSQGNQVKAARESIANSKDQQEILARQLKASVLGKYKQYKAYGAQIAMESELNNDIAVAASQAEQQFRQGRITADVYILAQRTKNEEAVKIMNLQLQQDLVRIDIEKMTGVSLDSILHPPGSNYDTNKKK